MEDAGTEDLVLSMCLGGVVIQLNGSSRLPINILHLFYFSSVLVSVNVQRKTIRGPRGSFDRKRTVRE